MIPNRNEAFDEHEIGAIVRGGHLSVSRGGIRSTEGVSGTGLIVLRDWNGVGLASAGAPVQAKIQSPVRSSW
jgi:hypothetical protein